MDILHTLVYTTIKFDNKKIQFCNIYVDYLKFTDVFNSF